MLAVDACPGPCNHSCSTRWDTTKLVVGPCQGCAGAGAHLHCSAAQVVLFAHGHRQSSWHSTNSLDYNVDRVRWEAVPGFAVRLGCMALRICLQILGPAVQVCVHQEADMPVCLVQGLGFD